MGERLRFGHFEVDLAARRLARTGEPVPMQPKVFDLLLHLLRHRERVVPREELQRALWADVAVAPGSLDRLVKELRRALGDDGRRQRWIRTVPRRGLRFEGGVHEAQPAASPAVEEAERALERARRAEKQGDASAATEARRDAAAAARRAPGPNAGALLARAALGLAGARLDYEGPRREVAELLREALVRIGPDEHPGLRARLEARLAAEERMVAPPARLAELRESALAAARRAEEDPAALAEVLATATAGIWERLEPGRRLRLASEAATWARRGGAERAEVRARWLRLHELLASGEIELFDAELEDLAEVVERRRGYGLERYFLGFHRVARACLAGRFEEAELLARQAFLAGRQHGDRSALDLFGTQLIVIRAEQGRLDELVPPTAAAAGEAPAASPRCLLAWMHARRRDAPAVRRLLAEIQERDLPRLAELPNAAANAGVLAEVAAFLADAPLAEQVGPLLEPERGRLLMRGVTAVHGPADYFRGLGLTARGEAAEADRALHAAEELAERLGAPSWAARARGRRG